MRLILLLITIVSLLVFTACAPTTHDPMVGNSISADTIHGKIEEVTQNFIVVAPEGRLSTSSAQEPANTVENALGYNGSAASGKGTSEAIVKQTYEAVKEYLQNRKDDEVEDPVDIAIPDVDVEEPVDPGGEDPVVDDPADPEPGDGDTDSGKPNPPNSDGALGGKTYKVNLEFRGNRPEFKKDGGFTNPSRPTFYSWNDSHAKYMVGGAEVTAVFPCGYKTKVTLLHRDAYGVVGWPNHKTGNRHFTMRMSETKGRGIAVLIPAEKWSLEKLKQGGTLYIKMPKR